MYQTTTQHGAPKRNHNEAVCMQLENDIAQHLEQGEFLALATVIGRSGSAPRHAGAQMVVTRDFSVLGTIGGGQVESDVLAACLPVRKNGLARILHFDMTGFSPDADMICGGVVDILIERLTPGHLPLFREAAACRDRAAFGVWLVDLSDPASPHRTFHTDAASLPQAVLEQVCSNAAACIDLDGKHVYVEPLMHQGVVVLCGGGHVSFATGKLAHEVGFEVIAVDDREEYAAPTRFPFARAVHVLPEFRGLAEACGIGPEHYIVIATRGHSYDRECLAQAMRTTAHYVGMIGSKRKRDGIFSFLRSEGFAEADFGRVHSPIGLEIGAETPEEIAVSIVAELIAARRGLA